MFIVQYQRPYQHIKYGLMLMFFVYEKKQKTVDGFYLFKIDFLDGGCRRPCFDLGVVQTWQPIPRFGIAICMA